MARRRTKRRTHVAASKEQDAATPKSMVIRVGGKSKDRTRATLGQLTKDVRTIMEPLTASKLRERQRNRLRDYVAMAGPLGVSHLLLFSRPSPTSLPSLRFVRCPRGPTLHFRILKYSLCKDVRRAQKGARSLSADFFAPPLLVMNNFSRTDASSQETLLTSMFQHLFPPISAQKTTVSSIKRVLLLHRDPKNENLVELRHYSITVRSVGVNRRLRKLAEKDSRPRASIPDLSSLQDISEYLLDDGATQTSDSEVDDDANVEVRNRDKRSSVEQKAIKLVEIGPRLLLDLVKIEEGVCRGKILYHAHIHKTKQEQASLEQQHHQQLAIKRKRRDEQQANVERKRKKNAHENGKEIGNEDEDEEEDEEESESDDIIDPLDELEMDSQSSVSE